MAAADLLAGLDVSRDRPALEMRDHPHLRARLDEHLVAAAVVDAGRRAGRRLALLEVADAAPFGLIAERPADHAVRHRVYGLSVDDIGLPPAGLERDRERVAQRAVRVLLHGDVKREHLVPGDVVAAGRPGLVVAEVVAAAGPGQRATGVCAGLEVQGRGPGGGRLADEEDRQLHRRRGGRGEDRRVVEVDLATLRTHLAADVLKAQHGAAVLGQRLATHADLDLGVELVAIFSPLSLMRSIVASLDGSVLRTSNQTETRYCALAPGLGGPIGSSTTSVPSKGWSSVMETGMALSTGVPRPAVSSPS